MSSEKYHSEIQIDEVDKQNKYTKLSDKQFVYLSKTKDEVKERLYQLLLSKSSDESFYPDLNGGVYLVVDKESLYYISFLVRYVNVSDFKVVDDIEAELSKIEGIFKPIHMTKNQGTLNMEIHIKKLVE